MERQKMKRQIENYILEVELAIREPIVERDIGGTVINSKKALFLLLPMLNDERWTARLNTAAIAVGAVHAAFDAHDSISPRSVSTKRQQLTVLAGDHFSGVHYKLLASLPEFDFIRLLSQTIGHINEMKTICHEQMPDSVEELLVAYQLIEAGCVVEFLNAFGFSRYAPFASSALPLLRLTAMRKEDGAMVDEQFGRRLEAESHQRLVTHLTRQLQEAIDSSDFLAPYLRNEIQQVIAPLTGKMI
ncbi:heptaprenyl diphosphate synthase component 1 [Sporosarcina sp. 179-K 3D1 HS]|uniref:heptaprenyl diphosphate synthase component 1 n=1 Tax=Sporosarcina sp. 179-K 3D1 HS TaxID=3232169 RepID=UPI0039A2681E